jgi:predicted transcriptional regulator
MREQKGTSVGHLWDMAGFSRTSGERLKRTEEVE